MRGEWIEIERPGRDTEPVKSLPMRGEWIEIRATGPASGSTLVSPHAGRVD